MPKCQHIGFMKAFTQGDKPYLELPTMAVTVWQNPNLPGNPHLVRYAFHEGGKTTVSWHYVTNPSAGYKAGDLSAMQDPTTNKLKAIPKSPGRFHHGDATHAWKVNKLPPGTVGLMQKINCVPPNKAWLTGLKGLSPWN